MAFLICEELIAYNVEKMSMTWLEILLEGLKKTTKYPSEQSVLQPSSHCIPLEYKPEMLPL